MRYPDAGVLVDRPAFEFVPHAWLQLLWPGSRRQGNGATLEAASETAGLLRRERPGNLAPQKLPFDCVDGDARGAALPLIVVQLADV